MSKNVIIGVLVLMSISLLGVVGLQLYWITDAIHVKQEEFDRSVNEALAKVVEKLETQEAANVVANQFSSLQNDSAALQKEPAPAKPVKQEVVAAKAAPATSIAASKNTDVAGHQIRKAENVSQFTRNSANGGSTSSPPKKIQLYFSKADSAKVKQAISRISGTKTTIVPSTIHGDAMQYQRLTPAAAESLSVAHLRKGGIYQLEPVTDTIKFFRIDKRPVRISVDTLKNMAVRMDSLLRLSKQPKRFRPVEIASIDVRNDSIFIIKGEREKPVYVTHNPSAQHNGTPLTKNKTRELQHAAGQPETHIFSFRTSASTSPGTTRRFVYKDSMQAAVTPLKPSMAPNKNIKTSAINKIEVKKDMLNDVVQKMVVEYVVKDEPLQKRLNLQTLPELLKSELENKGINLDFGYWVVSGQNDTVATNNLQPLKKLDVPKYKASLFPNDIFDKPDYLGLYFADSRTYAIKSLWGMLSLSALFTLVMIATFGTTIHIIYKQKKLSEMKNDFINNMTHEFKTPIATISLATDAIANPKIYEHPEKIKHYTGIIKQENKRMNVQVENVLQIARLEKNDFKLDFKPVDVHILITKAIESIRLQVEERLGQIHIQLNALQHELNSDEVHLFNVICNLLDNANKYSPTSPDIKLVTQNVAGGLLIAVEDKGMGMSKETQQRVFDKFYRVPTGNLHNVKGFGLGLSYVKAIVQAHKGNVRLKSEPGKGSRFEIFLPLS
ncbi:sensor histidine kinase [Pontibacter cellulosilyticus]|uniref:histidine kinase n=1 Tax=Pontibacter cellulosilyticus TaxID=1720253 RepID=A0A923NCA0_9BACT|nr:HAMP domain-containing sensor histidine kinase [Pontibacter cellulosilyticus]MBC5994295.1 HAMP domain-containing histidine kinase [Pontibacter cellulosilyticus]